LSGRIDIKIKAVALDFCGGGLTGIKDKARPALASGASRFGPKYGAPGNYRPDQVLLCSSLELFCEVGLVDSKPPITKATSQYTTFATHQVFTGYHTSCLTSAMTIWAVLEGKLLSRTSKRTRF
jgi:hypothetical protein